MNPQQHSRLEIWIEDSVTERLLLWLQRRQQTEIPNQLLACRKLGNKDRFDDLLAELQALKDLETAIRTGSFMKEQQAKQITQ